MSDDVSEPLLPLWSALADLFLDTDVMLLVPNIARQVVASGLSLDDVEEILRWQVRPAFYANLLSIAGEWAGWPDEYVLEKMRRPNANLAARMLLGRNRFFPDREWSAVIAEVSRLRGRS